MFGPQTNAIRKICRTELVGIAELSERIGVRETTIHKWKKKYPDFPAPLVTLKAGPVYLMSDVTTWLDRPRPVGRPRKKKTLQDST